MALSIKAKNAIEGPITLTCDEDGKLVQIGKSFDCAGGRAASTNCAPERLRDHTAKDADGANVDVKAGLKVAQFTAKDVADLEALLAKLSAALCEVAGVD